MGANPIDNVTRKTNCVLCIQMFTMFNCPTNLRKNLLIGWWKQVRGHSLPLESWREVRLCHCGLCVIPMHLSGTEAMEGAIKLARQFYFETGQPQRVNFIARKQSFHGNSIGTLALGNHPGRRSPYVDIFPSNNFHHVSPAYALWYKNAGESEEEYVKRLADELDAKFQELGPNTVIACESPARRNAIVLSGPLCSRRGNRRGGNYWRWRGPKRLF